MTRPPADFRALSARLGSDPLQVQGPGGNTSIKIGEVMWIKASGTELAEAEDRDIFVAVNREAARQEALGAGDGTCQATVIDPEVTLRPSIETTFHALLDWPVVAHTHSVATLVHAIGPAGRQAAMEKLTGLDAVCVPYCKPGLPLTRAIAEKITKTTRVIVLENHGLVCCGESVADVSELIAQVESLLAMPVLTGPAAPVGDPPKGYAWNAVASVLAIDDRLRGLVTGRSYYPDHVVFLGSGLPVEGGPALRIEGCGVALRDDATPSQVAMTECMAHVLTRLPADWNAVPIGPDAEAALLNWDAEKYRQALADKAHG